jgi:hypothetical protein
MTDIILFTRGFLNKECIDQLDTLRLDLSKEVILNDMQEDLIDLLLLKVFHNLFDLRFRHPFIELLSQKPFNETH